MKEFEFSLNIVERLIDIAKKKDISKLKVKYKEFEVYIDLKEPIFEGEFSTKAGKEKKREEYVKLNILLKQDIFLKSA